MKNYKSSLTLARAAMTLAGAPTRRAAMMLLIALLTATTGWAQSSFSGGSGTKADPYKISSSADLVQLATDINNSTSRLYEDQYFVQTGNIDMSGINFVPIGINDNNNHRFRGFYNGQNYTISNLTVNGSYDYAGLFGYIYNGEIDNVRLVSPSITTTNSRASYTGTLVGYADMPGIHNCLVINPTLSGGNSIGVFAGRQNDGNIKYTYYTGNNNYSNVGYTNGSNANTSIGHAYALTLSGGATTSTAAAFTYNSTDYYAGTITLSNAAPAGWIYAYTVNGSPIDGTSFTINADATVALSRTPDPAHFSVNDAGTEYTIHTADGWSVFCDCLNDNDTYNRFSGKTVRLGDNITVSRMAGGQYHDFCGTFDGQGNTLTVNISSDDITDGSTQYVAPFRYVSNTKADPSDEADSPATIRNLHVTGTITTDKQFTGGLIGGCWGTVIVENCRVSTAITSTISGDGTHGSIVGIQQNGSLYIRGTVFDGSLLGSTTYAVGGFLGWRKSGAEIRNSLFAPAEVTVLNTSGATFARNKVDTYNSYYTTLLNDGTNYVPYDPADADHPDKYNNGHMRRTITAGDNVTIGGIALTGTATQYTVSGITAYSGGGLKRGETLYYGSGDEVSLTLSNSATGAPQGYQYGYTASAGTLSGTILTMPDEDVTISVNTAALAPIDWATVSDGDSEEDPYMIYNKDQLLLLAHRVNGTNGETANTYEGMYFKLGADITFDHDANETDDYAENYEAIGGYIGGTIRYFLGDFDGDGHTVSGIRIRKTGSSTADIYQGLFGCISSGADIHDVHLTDARITGCQSVGGIVGYNNASYIRRCSVTDSYITATGNWNYGTICGSTAYTSYLRNNYYHGCTVNGTENATNVGCGGSEIADLPANNGARPAYAITLGDGVSTTALASAPENGFVYNGVSYYREGLALPLASTLGSEAPEGYTLSFSANGTALSGNTYTVNSTDGDVTITTTLRSDGLQHEVSYVDADGTARTAQAIALDGTETNLAAGWYFVGKDIDYTATITLGGDGDVNLILADGCTMNIGSSGSRINGHGIVREARGDQALTIYGQTAGTGTLSIYTDNGNNGIAAKAVTINGGNVTIDANGQWSTGIYAGVGNIIINSGNVNVTATDDNTWGLYANANVNVNGGNVNATGGSSGIRTDNGGITLGYTNPTDYILSSGYETDGAKVADGLCLTDGTSTYTGTLTDEQLAAIANQKLTPANLYVINGNSDDDVSFTEQKEHATIIYDRKFTAGVASTIVLPFDFDATALGGTLHTISSIDEKDGKWVATASTTAITEGKANTPYLFKPNSDIVSTTFKDVTIVPTAESATTIGESNWQMKGVYQFKEWDEDSPTDYGFAGAAQTTTEGDEISAGDFVRVGSGAKIRATRCYLTYDDGISKVSPILPDRITVIFPDATASIIEPQPADPSEDADPSGDITTPISEIAAQSGTKVWGYDGTIYIESQPYTPYTMIDLAGRTLQNGVTNSTREEVTLSRPAGIVIVRIGGKTFKIFNR